MWTIVSWPTLAAALLLASAPAAGAAADSVPDGAPFGIGWGEPLSALGPTQPLGSNVYLLAQPPHPEEHFPYVTVVAFDDIGVCEIFAGSLPFSGDVNGSLAKAEVDRVYQLLQPKYGAAKKIDTCDGAGDGAQPLCSTAWAQKSQQHKAAYLYDWDFSAAPVIGAIRVRLAAYAGDAQTTQSSIRYDSAALRSRCEAEKHAADDNSL